MAFTKSILRFAGGGSMAMSAPAAFAPRQASRPTRRSCAGERTEGLIRLQEAQSIVTHFRMDIFVWPRRTMPERIVSTAANQRAFTVEPIENSAPAVAKQGFRSGLVSSTESRLVLVLETKRTNRGRERRGGRVGRFMGSPFRFSHALGP